MTLIFPAEDMTAAPEHSAEGGAGYTIDELASTSRVPSRTIRFYQSKGLLPKPSIKGRVAYYGSEHRERLELIAQLQDRGLRIDTIRDLLARIDKGELDLGAWLGLEAQLAAPWANDRPVTVSEDELYELAGRRRVGLLNDLLRAGLAERQGQVFLVRSPALLSISTRLEREGIDLSTAARGGEILRKHLGRATKDLTELFVQHAEHLEEGDHGRVLEELRPLVLEAVGVIFGQEMERRLRDLVRSGKSAKVARRRGKKV
jgi:DNA-binding transcriptional MerR regulator